jgi:chromosome segregation ATPase
MAKDATESAKAMFMAKKSVVKKLDDHMKDALRAASVFLDDKQRGMVSSLLQAPFTGNYNSQSGEIVGVLKNMNDTFTANLANAQQVESKGIFDYNAMMTVMSGEYDDMSALFEKRKKEIGETSELVSRTSSEMNTAKERLSDDTDFLASLTSRCAKKKAEFDKRNMLRSQEEAAIAEAIAVLNSDEAFSTFGTVDATSTGGTGFVQISESQNEDVQKVESKAAAALALASKKLHSVRLARIAMELSSKGKSTNPFVKVLENINGTVELIDAEEADDAQKLATCNKEQDINFKRRDDKKDKMDELTGTIGELEISAKSTREQIESTEESLAENRAGQKESTDARNDQNAVFKKELKNLEDAEKILAKATKVLVKYYKFLHSHNAEKTYKEVDGKDSGGGNLRQVTPGFGANPELAIQEACSEDPACVAYNSAGWLKSSLAPEDEWYAWDGGKLFIKELNGVPATEAGTQLLQSKSKAKAHAKQPADVDFEKEDAEFADSQSSSGNKVIDMLTYIASETAEEKKTAIDTEQSAVDTFDDEMKTAKDAESGMMTAIDGFKLDLADTEKSLQEANAELSTTTDEHTATVKYLDDIEPGCTFIQTNYDGRKAAREAEKDALANAVSTLKATPIFQRFLAEAEKEAMGKCAPLCEGDLEPKAECQACLQGVSVFGYCVTNPDAPGCENVK